MKVGIVFSCFDLLHAGHILMLKEAKKNCDYLIACLHADPSMERHEKNEPIQSMFERYVQLSAVKYVDEIIPYMYESEVETILKSIQPTVRFMGDDYLGKPFTGHDLDIDIHYISRDHGFSSSSLRQKIKEA